MNPARQIIIQGLRGYQVVLSPVKTLLFGPFDKCRFEPSCSQYAIQAITRFGVKTGGWLALKRVARCHPWGSCGHDPVPPAGEGIFASAGHPHL